MTQNTQKTTVCQQQQTKVSVREPKSSIISVVVLDLPNSLMGKYYTST